MQTESPASASGVGKGRFSLVIYYGLKSIVAVFFIHL